MQTTESKFANLSEIVQATLITKASLSKSLLNFRDSIGLRLCAGKRDYSRDVYRRAQKSAVAAAVHSSCKRKTA